MIIEIGAILSLEDVEILVNFINKSLGYDMGERRAKIAEMQKSGMWDIYENLRIKIKDEEED